MRPARLTLVPKDCACGPALHTVKQEYFSRQDGLRLAQEEGPFWEVECGMRPILDGIERRLREMRAPRCGCPYGEALSEMQDLMDGYRKKPKGEQARRAHAANIYRQLEDILV
jgi:hypothetical protein